MAVRVVGDADEGAPGISVMFHLFTYPGLCYSHAGLLLSVALSLRQCENLAVMLLAIQVFSVRLSQVDRPSNQQDYGPHTSPAPMDSLLWVC